MTLPATGGSALRRPEKGLSPREDTRPVAVVSGRESVSPARRADTGGPPDWLLSGRIPSLDGLRAVAVLLVVWSHAHETKGFPDFAVLHAVGRVGHVGVEVFFVISGFLITVLMLRELGRSGRLSIRRFYLRRALRIVPAYACLLGVVATLDVSGYDRLAGRDWAAALTYTVNFLRRPAWDIGHAWSLSIEEHFYLAWPLALATLSLSRSRGLALACMAFCFLARWVVLLFFPASSPMAELWTFTRIDSIALGCLLAFLAWDPATRSSLNSWTLRRWSTPLAIATLVVSLALSTQSAKFAVGVAYSLNAACLALLVWVAVNRGDSPVGALLNHKALRWVGVSSYSLYLWQQLFLNKGRSGFISRFPQNVFLAVLVAFLSYSLIEAPFLRWKGRIAGD